MDLKSKIIMTGVVGFVLCAVLIGFWVNYSYLNCQEVVKTDAGEFIIHDGKIYSVYEMERSSKGELQVGVK